MEDGPFPPDSPVVVDDAVTKRKLRELLRHEAEYSNLDYKRAFEVSSTRGKAEFAKDVGAMQPRGGYIVGGVSKKGIPTSDLDGVSQDIFDPSSLLQQLYRYLPKTVTVSSQFHEIDGHDVLLICVHRNPLGYAIFHTDGQYTQNGKSDCAFHAGEIYWRNGPTSEHITPEGLERIIEWRIATGITKAAESEREPLPEVVPRYLRETASKEGWADRTVEGYSYDFRRLVTAHKDFTLAYFEPPLGTDRLRKFIDIEWHGYAISTRNKVTTVFQGFFHWAYINGLLRGDPAALLERVEYRGTPRRQVEIGHELAERIITEQPLLHHRVALALVGRLGMTKGEIRVVRFGDVDVANEQAATRDSREQRTGAVRVTHSGLLAELTELDRMRRDDGFKQTDYLLHKRGYDGTSFSDSGAHRWFKTRLERVRGAPDIKLEFRFQARATDVEVV